MEINEAIAIVKNLANTWRRCAERNPSFKQDYLKEAEAMETICQALTEAEEQED